MNKTVEAIYDILAADDTLVSLLALNPPFYNPNGDEARVNSIIPADIVENSMTAPFLVIQEGSELKIGSKLESQSLFFRCYNDRQKSYITIDEILNRIKAMLDNLEITVENKVVVKLGWEATMPGLLDESLGMKFKESRYRLLVL